LGSLFVEACQDFFYEAPVLRADEVVVLLPRIIGVFVTDYLPQEIVLLHPDLTRYYGKNVSGFREIGDDLPFDEFSF
jgi:hypothetical protein